MGMKQPKGEPKKVGGTVSSPNPSASCYNKMGNAATSAHEVDGPKNIGNSTMPPPKGTGTPRVY